MSRTVAPPPASPAADGNQAELMDWDTLSTADSVEFLRDRLAGWDSATGTL